jgi:hypothetical protein
MGGIARLECAEHAHLRFDHQAPQAKLVDERVHRILDDSIERANLQEREIGTSSEAGRDDQLQEGRKVPFRVSKQSNGSIGALDPEFSQQDVARDPPAVLVDAHAAV